MKAGILDHALTWFSNLWIYLIVILDLAVMVRLVASADGWWSAIRAVEGLLSPYDVLYVVAQIILFSPAAGALYWRDHRRKKRGQSA